MEGGGQREKGDEGESEREGGRGGRGTEREGERGREKEREEGARERGGSKREAKTHKCQMELPDPIPIQNFIHPTPGGEEGQSAALAAGAARDGVARSEPSGTLRLRSTRQKAVSVLVLGSGYVWAIA